MNRLLLDPAHPAFQQEWLLENITTTFFKCTRWQLEETTDPINCPYHYFCDSTYPGNYPPIVDLSVLFLTAVCYLVTTALTALEIKGCFSGTCLSRPKRRFWVPSGPIALPFILLALAKGQRINTVFPMSYTGPALLQLVHISALAFENTTPQSGKYVMFEVSTVSAILHASLYLDSVVLPYYTGLEALVSSTFSGQCTSCVCRKEVLVVGGRWAAYRGWSVTTFSVVGALFSRIVCGLFGEDMGSLLIKLMLEGLGWILITADGIYLMVNSLHGGLMEKAVFGGICGLICLLVLKKVCNLLACPNAFLAMENNTDSRFAALECLAL